MLKNLLINNIALIDKISVEFGDGLCVLSGETGAGKSIIVDSLAFVLGGRADKSLIKSGEDRAFVEAVFETEENSVAAETLEQLGFERDSTIVLSRSMTTAGKNECRINGRLSSLTMLKSLSAALADIFGQSEHIGILKTNTHLKILDAFDLCPHLLEMSRLFAEYKSNQSRLEIFGGSPSERERALDLLGFEINEIEKAALSEDEESELVDFKSKIANVEKIASALKSSLAHLNDGANIASELWLAATSLGSAVAYDAQLNDLSARLTSAKYEIDDVVSILEEKIADCDYSPSQADRVEERLEVYKRLKRKYGATVLDVLQYCEQSKVKYNALIDATAEIEKINAQMLLIKKDAYELAEKCSQYRKEAAERFCALVTNELNDVGMKNAQFSVQFSPKPSFEEYIPSANGFDNVEFLFSANLGEPLKPLARVISGGEMSRFLLAVKNITARIENIPTMVFDEIDVGLSGNIAQMVAKKLANISKYYQCIVITHLPQVAAMGETNLLISKSVKDGKTYTHVLAADHDTKTKEVARLMGGENIGEYGLLHAKEMLDWAVGYKNSLI